MRKTRFRKFAVGIYHKIKKKKLNRHLYQDFSFCQTNSTITRYRTVRLGAPAKFVILHTIDSSKSAKSLILLHIKNPDAVWIYARPVYKCIQFTALYQN
jgi:hypothetical protein